MNFDFDAEQTMLKKSAQEFFSKEFDSAMVREMETDAKGYSQKIWGKMAKLGWTGLLIPDSYGGEEMDFIDMAVVLEEMGYAAFASPFFPTAVMSVLALLEAASEEQKKDILPDIAHGKKILTLAWNEQDFHTTLGGVRVKAVEQDNDYIITGTKLFVPYAHIADQMICALRTDDPGAGGEEGISLFMVDHQDPGLEIEPLDTIADDKQCEVSFDHVRIPKENMLGKLNQGGKINQNVLLKSAVAKCAEMTGGARKVLKMTVDYAKKREQFGRPIGSFQAIQHHCANMLTYLDTSTMMTYQACWQISQGLAYEKQAAMAKAWVSDAYRQLTALGHQVMGGFGFMEEVDHQLYYRRAKAAELIFGDATMHREIVAQNMGL
jgi:alkylation response protein AidB-like acyl-CoA dehydrogenase